MNGTGSRTSARVREAWRKRWRAFLAPHWKRLAREVLDPREAKVLGLRLGMISDVGLAQRQIARRLHVGDATIAHIEKRALAKVTAALNVEGTT
jgi:DNA-directed RNA polymerase sigma subunit (sigma70/sigma32)